MMFHMVQFMVELDDRCARDLERVAPARKRMRAAFVRLAIRRAVDLALDGETAEAYAATARPADGAVQPADLLGWDADNALARSARAVRQPGTRATKRSATSRRRKSDPKRAA